MLIYSVQPTSDQVHVLYTQRRQKVRRRLEDFHTKVRRLNSNLRRIIAATITAIQLVTLMCLVPSVHEPYRPGNTAYCTAY